MRAKNLKMARVKQEAEDFTDRAMRYTDPLIKSVNKKGDDSQPGPNGGSEEAKAQVPEDKSAEEDLEPPKTVFDIPEYKHGSKSSKPCINQKGTLCKTEMKLNDVCTNAKNSVKTDDLRFPAVTICNQNQFK